MSWVDRNIPNIALANVYVLEYGEDKTSVTNPQDINVLVDDNKTIRKNWREHGKNFLTIDASHSFCREIEGLAM